MILWNFDCCCENVLRFEFFVLILFGKIQRLVTTRSVVSAFILYRILILF